jgi:hypothetical protein
MNYLELNVTVPMQHQVLSKYKGGSMQGKGIYLLWGFLLYKTG